MSKSESQQGNTLAMLSATGRDCTENKVLLVAQALLELIAKLVQQANYLAFCESIVAHSLLACWRKWILGKKAGLFCQTAQLFQGLVAYGFLLAAVPQSEAMLTTDCRGQHAVIVNALQ